MISPKAARLWPSHPLTGPVKTCNSNSFCLRVAAQVALKIEHLISKNVKIKTKKEIVLLYLYKQRQIFEYLHDLDDILRYAFRALVT